MSPVGVNVQVRQVASYFDLLLHDLEVIHAKFSSDVEPVCFEDALNRNHAVQNPDFNAENAEERRG